MVLKCNCLSVSGSVFLLDTFYRNMNGGSHLSNDMKFMYNYFEM